MVSRVLNIGNVTFKWFFLIIQISNEALILNYANAWETICCSITQISMKKLGSLSLTTVNHHRNQHFSIIGDGPGQSITDFSHRLSLSKLNRLWTSSPSLLTLWFLMIHALSYSFPLYGRLFFHPSLLCASWLWVYMVLWNEDIKETLYKAVRHDQDLLNIWVWWTKTRFFLDNPLTTLQLPNSFWFIGFCCTKICSKKVVLEYLSTILKTSGTTLTSVNIILRILHLHLFVFVLLILWVWEPKICYIFSVYV